METQLVNRLKADTTSSNLAEMVTMLVLSVAVVTVVSVLATVLDLSTVQSIKISVAHIILIGMLVERFLPFGN